MTRWLNLNHSSLSDLPFIEAVYKEILRWRPVAPFSLPHSSLEEDVFYGMIYTGLTSMMYLIAHTTHNRLRYPCGHYDYSKHMVSWDN